MSLFTHPKDEKAICPRCGSVDRLTKVSETADNMTWDCRKCGPVTKPAERKRVPSGRESVGRP